jgi:hypothetical protein
MSDEMLATEIVSITPLGIELQTASHGVWLLTRRTLDSMVATWNETSDLRQHFTDIERGTQNKILIKLELMREIKHRASSKKAS